VEESTAETLNIDMCLTSGICEGYQRWRNRVIFGYFKTFLTAACLPPQKNIDFPEPHF
jgi:hypothetical protein